MAESLHHPLQPIGADAPPEEVRCDVAILGGTPAGIAAAIAAARLNKRVLLLERTNHIGGLMANGLGATDIETRGATGGLFANLVERIRSFYADTYGADSPQVRDCSGGYHFEPSVAEAILEAMLQEHPQITVRRLRQFDAFPENVISQGRRIDGLLVTARDSGRKEVIRAHVFVDCTYEGDLAAAAGCGYRLGREDAREFGEKMAGQLYKPWGGLPGPGSSGRGDNAIQAYNFRLPLTSDPSNQAPFGKPRGYASDEYASLIDDLAMNRHAGLAGSARPELEWDGIGRVVNLVRLPNGKTDANNQHAAFLSTDLPEENWPWPTASWEWRDRFERRLRDYTLGLLWFCQNDERLPADFRAQCARWGLARDEYVDNGNFPRQVYVREGRRILGEYFFTAQDVEATAPGGRPPIHRESITASHYALDSHAVRKREGGRVHLDGFFSSPSVPYTVPYGVMVPKEVDGLLVPVALSASHVGLSTLRMEPCWIAIGEAAGVAAALAVERQIPVRTVPVRQVQAELLRRGAVLVYFQDLAPGQEGFEAAQWAALDGHWQEWSAPCRS